MKNEKIFILIFCITLNLFVVCLAKDDTPEWLDSNDPINNNQIFPKDYPYLVQWLNRNAKPAQDYIIQLFDKYQIVIFGEEHNVKEHKDFIIDLIPKLYHEAGVRCIGWEFSHYSQNKQLEDLVNAPNYDEKAVLKLARDYSPDWNSKEHWLIIKAIWSLNQSLKPSEEKMRLIGLPDYFDIAKMYTILKTKQKDSPEFQEMLKQTVETDKLMAQHVEKDFLQKGYKAFLFVGMGHDWIGYQYPPEATFGIQAKSMGVYLKEKYRDQVFQVRAQASADPSIINQIMKCRNHVSTGLNMQDSPFANILVWVGRGAPDVPWVKLAEGYLYLGSRVNFNSNTPIKDYVNDQTFEKYKRYYDVCYGNGRSFNNAKEVDEYLQQNRWPKPR